MRHHSFGLSRLISDSRLGRVHSVICPGGLLTYTQNTGRGVGATLNVVKSGTSLHRLLSYSILFQNTGPDKVSVYRIECMDGRRLGLAGSAISGILVSDTPRGGSPMATLARGGSLADASVRFGPCNVGKHRTSGRQRVLRSGTRRAIYRVERPCPELPAASGPRG